MIVAEAKNELINLTGDIVSAFVANNSIASAEIAGLIASVHGALANIGKPAAIEKAKQEPAVSIRSMVKPDSVACLECGFRGKVIRRHITISHHLTLDEYKTKWNLPGDFTGVAPDYAEARKQLALKMGLGRKPAKAAKASRRRKMDPAEA